MTPEEIRQRIAREAALLMLRGKERNVVTARQRAARWLKRHKLTRQEIPTPAEIHEQMWVLSGILHTERDPAVRQQLRHYAAQLVQLLMDFSPRCLGAVIAGPTTPGVEIILAVEGALSALSNRLISAGIHPRISTASSLAATDHSFAIENWCTRADGVDITSLPPCTHMLVFKHQFPCRILLYDLGQLPHDLGWDATQLLTSLQVPAETLERDVDDVYQVFQILLEPLAQVLLDPHEHPEGDALYHSLQVFELGRRAVPWDEEFLQACLLHEIGRAIDPQHPVESGLETLEPFVTQRTLELIRGLPRMLEILEHGKSLRTVRRSEHYEDWLLLAQCDRRGRQPGMPVPELHEALDYLRQLSAFCEGDADTAD